MLNAKEIAHRPSFAKGRTIRNPGRGGINFFRHEFFFQSHVSAGFFFNAFNLCTNFFFKAICTFCLHACTNFFSLT
jgi:hypothetical protein